MELGLSQVIVIWLTRIIFLLVTVFTCFCQHYTLLQSLSLKCWVHSPQPCLESSHLCLLLEVTLTAGSQGRVCSLLEQLIRCWAVELCTTGVRRHSVLLQDRILGVGNYTERVYCLTAC